MVDSEISHNIQNVKAKEELFSDLYEGAFPIVAAFVSHRQGYFSGCQRYIFQDALVIFYEKLVNGALKISVSDEAYVLGN